MTKASMTITLLCCCFAFALAGCAPSRQAAPAKESFEPVACTPVQTTASFLNPAAQAPPPATVAGSVPAQELVEPARQQLPAVEEPFRPLAMVNFSFDSYLLDAAARDTLHQFYLSVKDATVPLTLEGFCDERGDEEYNLSLADRRSRTVRKFLVDLGLKPELLAAVGYGREYPIDPAHNEQAWQQNRRVEIVAAGAPKPGSKKRYGTVE